MSSDHTTLIREMGEALIAAFDHVGEVHVFVKNSRREFVAFSEPFLRLMGFTSADQLLGKRDEEISPEYLVEHYRSYDERVLSTGEPIIDLVELVRNRDGSYDWFLSTKTAIRDQQGAIIGVMGVTRALTNRNSKTERLLSLTPAVEYISREYATQIKVEDLAAQVMMSPAHFNRVFKQHFGTTPYRYLMRIRIMAASDLLATTSLPIGQIASQTGFYDASHLTNEFRRANAVNPTEYRRRFQPLPVYRSQRHGALHDDAAPAARSSLSHDPAPLHSRTITQGEGR